MTVVRDQLFPQKPPGSRFDPRVQRFSPPLARQRSSCPPPSPNLVRTHPIENYQALRDSAPCLLRAATLPKATKLELGRGAHLKTPSSANHTAAASQPTGGIAKAASWLHLLRVSPALHPPERPSHTHTPKPGFGGRGHERIGDEWEVIFQRASDLDRPVKNRLVGHAGQFSAYTMAFWKMPGEKERLFSATLIFQSILKRYTLGLMEFSHNKLM